MKLISTGLLSLVLTCFASGVELPMEMEELSAGNGRVYKGVKIVSADDIGIKIIHESGTARLSFDLLPEELAAKFDYDPEAAKAQREEELRRQRDFNRKVEAELKEKAEAEAQAKAEEEARKEEEALRKQEEKQRRREEFQRRDEEMRRQWEERRNGVPDGGVPPGRTGDGRNPNVERDDSLLNGRELARVRDLNDVIRKLQREKEALVLKLDRAREKLSESMGGAESSRGGDSISGDPRFSTKGSGSSPSGMAPYWAKEVRELQAKVNQLSNEIFSCNGNIDFIYIEAKKKRGGKDSVKSISP